MAKDGTVHDLDGAEIDELSKLTRELKRQKMVYDSAPKKSSIHMRTLSESIRKLTARLEECSLLWQQVLFQSIVE